MNDYRLPDEDLTVLVERAAQDIHESRHGLPWENVSKVHQNLLREQMLPVIFHATKALHDLGYRKPRTITTAEELDALPSGSVIVDRDGDAWQRYTTGWTCTDRAMNTVDQPSVNLTNILGPATVLREPK